MRQARVCFLQFYLRGAFSIDFAYLVEPELDKCDLFIVSSPFQISSVINKGRPVLLLETSEIPTKCSDSSLLQDTQDLAGLPPLLPFPKQLSNLSTLTNEQDFSESNLTKYMDSYRTSGLSDIADYLSQVSNLAQNHGNLDTPNRLQLHTAYANAAQVISTLHIQFTRSIAQLRNLRGKLDLFLEKIESEIESLQVHNIKVEGAEEARLKVTNILNSRLAWWKLPWRSDDIVPVLRSFVQTEYLGEFEIMVRPFTYILRKIIYF